MVAYFFCITIYMPATQPELCQSKYSSWILAILMLKLKLAYKDKENFQMQMPTMKNEVATVQPAIHQQTR